MARLARVTVPGLPHHVTQRGNRLQPVFFAGKIGAVLNSVTSHPMTDGQTPSPTA